MQTYCSHLPDERRRICAEGWRCEWRAQRTYRRTHQNRRDRLPHSSGKIKENPGNVSRCSLTYLKRSRCNMCRYAPNPKQTKFGACCNKNCWCYAKWAFSCPCVDLRRKGDASAERHPYISERSYCGMPDDRKQRMGTSRKRQVCTSIKCQNEQTWTNRPTSTS